MHDVEWKKVFAGILSEKAKEREETYIWVHDKFWNEDVLERLKNELDKRDKTLNERLYIIDAMAAVGLEKATSPLAKKRAEYHHKIKENRPDSPENGELQRFISYIDAALKQIIGKIKSKNDVSLKNLVQKSFAFKKNP